MSSAQRCWHCGHPYLSQLQQDLMSALVADPTRSNAELGLLFDRPESTIKNRLSELYATIGVRSRIELVLLAQKLARAAELKRRDRGGHAA